MSELKYDNSYKLNKLVKYIEYMDPDFLEDLEKLFSYVLEESQDLISSDIMSDIASINNEDDIIRIADDLFLQKNSDSKFLSLNEIIEITSDFFKTISPIHQQIFLNLIPDKKTKFKIDDDVSILNSFENKIYLQKSYIDVIMLVHEKVHSFTYSSSESTSFSKGLLEESNAICYEQLAEQYLEEKYGINSKVSSVRIFAFFAFKLYDYPCLKAWKELCKIKKENEDLNFANIEYYNRLQLSLNNKLTGNFCSKELDDDLPFYFNHELGFLIACYLNEQFQAGNIQALEAITTAISYNTESEAEMLKMLESMNIPIVKDGKISLKGDNFMRLAESFSRFYANYKNTQSIDRKQPKSPKK